MERNIQYRGNKTNLIMTHKKKIRDIFKHTSRLISTPRGFKLVNPSREWVIGVSAATLIFIGGGIYAGILFLGESERDYLNTTVTNIDVVSYKYDLIRDVLSIYALKQERFDSLKLNYIASSPIQPASTTTEEANKVVAEDGDIQVE